MAQENKVKSSDIERYAKLVHAIEFFSQRFDLAEIRDYIYQFTRSLLDCKDIIMMIEDNGVYKDYQAGQATTYAESFDKEEIHDELVYFHAGLLTQESIDSIVPEGWLDKRGNITFGIPLIMDKKLYGFILVYKKESSPHDTIIAEALMNLFLLALTTYESYDVMEGIRKELDQKIFNLFAINHASKALLSEMNEQRLVDLSMSVFAELTQSRITSVYIYDEISHHYEFMGMLDVFNEKNPRPIHFQRKRERDTRLKVVVPYHNVSAMERFQKFFQESLSVLNMYEPHYIINLIRDGQLLGFVTLSERVNKEPYERGIFELIESLASAMLVAISNARNVARLDLLHQQSKTKFERLNRLNQLIKNMNSATDSSTLMELTLKTLSISFGYKTSCFALYNGDKKSFVIRETIGYEGNGHEINKTPSELGLIEGKPMIVYPSQDKRAYLSLFLPDYLLEDIQGMIVVPVVIEGLEAEHIGMIALFDVQEGVLTSEENVLTLETMANHIAPILKQLLIHDHHQERLRMSSLKEFVNLVNESCMQAMITDSNLYISVVSSEEVAPLDNDAWERIFPETDYVYDRMPGQSLILHYSRRAYEQMCKDYNTLTIRSWNVQENGFDAAQLFGAISQYLKTL